MDEISNDTLFNALMNIKGDIGGLKTSTDLFVKGLENHSIRIGALEGTSQRQKGAVTAWGLAATAMATVAGGVIQWFRH